VILAHAEARSIPGAPRHIGPAATAEFDAPQAFAHDGLQSFLSRMADPDRPARTSIEFLEPEQLMAAGAVEIPIIVPAVNEAQAKFLERLRQHLCLTPILAVVADLSGHQTCRAMLGGATSVLNTELPHARQDSVLRAVLGAAPPTPPPSRTAVPAPVGDPAAGDELLVRLLCGANTVAAIARRFYCSERSMYRRVRRLYDAVGVSSRSELRILVAQRASV
jgi:DNA-binding NarL/FixJ family response regulator